MQRDLSLSTFSGVDVKCPMREEDRIWMTNAKREARINRWQNQETDEVKCFSPRKDESGAILVTCRWWGKSERWRNMITTEALRLTLIKVVAASEKERKRNNRITLPDVDQHWPIRKEVNNWCGENQPIITDRLSYPFWLANLDPLLGIITR